MSAVAQQHASHAYALRPAPASVRLSGWALLGMDGVTLALPQKDVVTIELVSALQAARQEDGGGKVIGWLAHDGERWPVYCLDRRFMPAPALAQAARVCVLFRSGGRTLGLAGTQVSLLAADEDLAVQPLPACLAQPDSPLAGLALHHDEIVMSVHVGALAGFLAPGENA